MIIPLAVGAGGALGSIARYSLSSIIARHFPYAFPAPILIVNVLGSLLLGLVIGWLAKEPTGHHAARLLLAVGFCGGFTTFSTFSLEAWELITTGRIAAASAYILGSVILSIAGLAFGLWIMRSAAV